MNAIGVEAAIVGIGQTPFSRSLGRSEFVPVSDDLTLLKFRRAAG